MESQVKQTNETISKRHWIIGQTRIQTLWRHTAFQHAGETQADAVNKQCGEHITRCFDACCSLHKQTRELGLRSTNIRSCSRKRGARFFRPMRRCGETATVRPSPRDMLASKINASAIHRWDGAAGDTSEPNRNEPLCVGRVFSQR